MSNWTSFQQMKTLTIAITPVVEIDKYIKYFTNQSRSDFNSLTSSNSSYNFVIEKKMVLC